MRDGQTTSEDSATQLEALSLAIWAMFESKHSFLWETVPNDM